MPGERSNRCCRTNDRTMTVAGLGPGAWAAILALFRGWGEIDRSTAPYLPRVTAAAMASVTPPPSRGPSSLSEPPAS